MSSIFDYAGGLDRVIFWFLWLIFFSIAWVLINRDCVGKAGSFKFPKNINSVLPVTIIVAVFLLSSCKGDSGDTARNQHKIITHQSPVMLLADTTRGGPFRCIELNPQTRKTVVTDTLFVQVSGDSVAAKSFRKKVRQHPIAFQSAGKRCLSEAGISADTAHSGASIFYAVPITYQRYATVINIDEQTPTFQETEKLPGKNLALQVKNDEEPGSLYGILMHGDPKRPLPNVKIVLTGTDTWSETNEDGEFYLDNLPSGIQQFEVNYLGHTIGIITMNIN